MIVVKSFLSYVTRHGFVLFAWWRVIVGTLGLNRAGDGKIVRARPVSPGRRLSALSLELAGGAEAPEVLRHDRFQRIGGYAEPSRVRPAALAASTPHCRCAAAPTWSGVSFSAPGANCSNSACSFARPERQRDNRRRRSMVARMISMISRKAQHFRPAELVDRAGPVLPSTASATAVATSPT